MASYWSSAKKRYSRGWWREQASNVWGFPRYLIWQYKKCRQWLPVIWEDAQFDQSFLYRILAFKLERMEEFWRSDKTFGEWNQQARDIMVCKNLMKRIESESYINWGHKDYNKHPYFKSPIKCWKWEQDRSKADKELFCRIFLRKVDSWWD